MTHHMDQFKRPTLHVVVADDEEQWSNLLENFFAEQVKKWSLCRTGQFEFKSYRRESINDFTETVEALLAQGDLVYATVDMKMPRKKGGLPGSAEWERTVSWCLQHGRDSQRFEFCVISAEEVMLDELFKHQKHGAELERKGIKRAYKKQIDESPEVALWRIWQDIRGFVLRHIRFCTVPDRPGAQAGETMVWFGTHNSLDQLLARTDEIAKSRDKGALYVLFADPCGYEEDWFRLCCHLRGVDSPTVDNFAELNRRDEGWRDHLKSPPKALLLSRLENSRERGFDVHEEILDSGFLGRLAAAQNFVCVQFPEFATELAASLDEKEIAVLNACLNHVYGSGPPFEEGAGFPYKAHNQIVRLPSYETLKRTGVIRATIEFQAAQCQSRYPALRTMPLDPEVLEVLAEMPWDESEGLDGLRMAIDRAYANADERKQDVGRFVDIEFFRRGGVVHKHFASSQGFAIRGRRLVHLLDRQWPIGPGTSPSATLKDVTFGGALAGLTQMHVLFERLQQLVDLAKQLQRQDGSIVFPEDFPPTDFAAVKAAHEFLQRIFKAPGDLFARIEAFRRFEQDRTWRDAYPSLEVREDWRELIEHVRFTWPNSRFRLPPPLDDYLRWSGVVADIYLDLAKVLPRYPELKLQWQENERQRRAIEEEVQECEVQRRNAERHAREERSQPVLMILGQPEDEEQPVLTVTLQSLLLFNAFIAVCENVYYFDGQLANRNDGRELLTRPELGLSIRFLRNYLRRLQESGKISRSVFAGWTNDWPSKGQNDAVRVIGAMSRNMLSDKEFGKSLTDEERRVVVALSELQRAGTECPVDTLLEFMGIIRNAFEKQGQREFLAKHGGDIRDCLRRFVFATTKPKVRFGQVTEDGRRATVWSRHKVVEVEMAKVATAHVGRTCVLIGDGHHPLFPIDDLIRIDVSDSSVLAHHGRKWVNLVHGQLLVKGPDVSYLPSPEEVKDSAVWRWAHE